MNDPTDFARWAAELEGDATVGAGSTRSLYVKHVAAGAASPSTVATREDPAQRIDHPHDTSRAETAGTSEMAPEASQRESEKEAR